MPNRLSTQNSPYLLQHKDNPVNWQPWDDQALTEAKRQNKPILLSIGYAACHWCHVMEKECFEDAAIAEIMNEHFVCIKVDREERPDLDKIYQASHHMLTERPGGWPLTMVLTPNGHAPFFAGTYFPAKPKLNLPGFGDLLKRISDHFNANAEQLSQHHHSFEKALTQLNPSIPSEELSDPDRRLGDAFTYLCEQFDHEFGGLGQAPKFPHPSQLELLLTHHKLEKSSNRLESLSMVEKTMTNMALGGIFDQIGGAFFRYSVDRKWTIPHFEKMLSDNAQLLGLYCDLYLVSDKKLYADAATGTAYWILNEMQQLSGGYSTSIDADSQDTEGKFYIWSETDLRALVTHEEYEVIEDYFALYGDPNFEGFWHLNVNTELTNTPEFDTMYNAGALQSAKARLLAHRNSRARPSVDDKVLTAWNGLAIRGMAKAGRTLGVPAFVGSAQKSADFVRENLWQNHRLLATCRNGRAQLNAYLDDYAFLLEGLLELLQSQWSNRNLEFAVMVADAMISHFEDTEKGGFFFTSHDHEPLLYRPKPGADDAIPAGNGSAVSGLIRLGHLIGNSRYLVSAENALNIFGTEIEKMPSVYASLTQALQQTRSSSQQIIIRGEREALFHWQSALRKSKPELLSDIYAIPNDVEGLPPALSRKIPLSETIAYVCHGSVCSEPISSLEELTESLIK